MTAGPQRTRAEWADLLSRRIQESGLSDTRFAREVLRREPRTLRKWQTLELEIPNEVKDFLARPSRAPWP